ncbi:MAG: aminomethyl-transferring glycine dehydrogenase subunit GcvPB, partial [Planctomycetaceae bacterium]|nr:aminomethyl-transferring glycine dehydrogenase subunit GcvPB [Planctomycetaceae bacterium]
MRNTLTTRLLTDLSVPGRRGATFPASDVPDVPLEQMIPADRLASSPPALPEVCEPDVVRHYVNLSTLNMSVDTHFYPLGSCTMKYNPKRHERLSKLPGIVDLHPYQHPSDMQGMLELLYEMQQMLAEIAGLPAVSLQPAAGAHGELTGMMVIKAAHTAKGDPRRIVLVPDSAHGTNPATAVTCGYEVVSIASTSAGLVDMAALEA